jgi:hypothetical protein
MSESPDKNEELPENAFWDERGDDDWDERDLAKLERSQNTKERNQAKTSGQPKDSEK